MTRMRRAWVHKRERAVASRSGLRSSFSIILRCGRGCSVSSSARLVIRRTVEDSSRPKVPFAIALLPAPLPWDRSLDPISVVSLGDSSSRSLLCVAVSRFSSLGSMRSVTACKQVDHPSQTRLRGLYLRVEGVFTGRLLTRPYDDCSDQSLENSG